MKPLDGSQLGSGVVRVLGLDLAAGHSGWAVLDVGSVSGQLVATGAFDLPTRRTAEDRADWNVRRGQVLAQALAELLQAHRPDVLAYEYPDRPFRSHWQGLASRRSTVGSEFHAAQGLGLAEGLLAAALGLSPLCPVNLYALPVGDIKRLVAGSDGASKRLVRRVLESRYGLANDAWDDDMTDAVSVALAGRIRHAAVQAERAARAQARVRKVEPKPVRAPRPDRVAKLPRQAFATPADDGGPRDG